jgi:hypothetical protein
MQPNGAAEKGGLNTRDEPVPPPEAPRHRPWMAIFLPEIFELVRRQRRACNEQHIRHLVGVVGVARYLATRPSLKSHSPVSLSGPHTTASPSSVNDLARSSIAVTPIAG